MPPSDHTEPYARYAPEAKRNAEASVPFGDEMKSDPLHPKSPDWLARRDHGGRTHGSRRASYREWQRERLLLDWLGGTFAPDAMADLRGPVKQVGDVVRDVLTEFDDAGALLLDRLIREWPELVGEDIAKISAPVRCENGVLHIGITNTTWRYVLEQQFRGRLLAQLRKASNGDVRNIRLVPAGSGSSARRAQEGNRPGN